MKKHFLSLLVVIFSIMCIIAISATDTANVSDDGLWAYQPYGDGIELTEYKGGATDVYVPSNIEVNGEKLDVVKLGNSIFEDNDSLNSVTLGAGIAEIGAKAFYDADNMVCILLAEDTTTIGAETFYSCDCFNSVILYDAVTTIGENAFAECSRLTVWCNLNSTGYNYAVANNIKYELFSVDTEPLIITEGGLTYYITNGEATAVDCDDTLTEVVVPATVQGYPVVELRETFRETETVTKVIISNGVKKISDYGFYKAVGLIEIEIPQSVIYVGKYAFSNCTNLSQVELPDNITIISNYTFNECISLEEFTISDTVTEIGAYAFCNCKALKEIVLPNSVTKIGSHAFWQCKDVTSLYIHGNVEYIGEEAFYACRGLISVTFEDGLTVLNRGVLGSCSNLKEIVLPKTLTKIETSAFYWCEKLEEITIPEGVTSIGQSVFYECDALNSISLPDNLVSIGSNAFYNCYSLTQITLPSGISEIAETAFGFYTVFAVHEDSYALSFAKENEYIYYIIEDGMGKPEIYIQDGVSYFISDGEAMAFDFDNSITEITVPSSINGYPVTNMREVFRAAKLKSVVLPNSLKKIGASSFYGCDYLTDITIPAGVNIIGENAFAECDNLINVKFSAGTDTIGLSAFANCKKLKNVTFVDGTTTIQGKAFSRCSELEEIAFPDSVTHIGGNAFEFCSSLKKVELPANLTKIYIWTFWHCKSLEEVILPKNVTTIENYAFDNCTSLIKLYIPSATKNIGSTGTSATVLIVDEGSYAMEYAEKAGRRYCIYDGVNMPEVSTCVDGSVTYLLIDNEAIVIDCDTSVTDVVVPEYVNGCLVVEISEGFRECTKMESITLPDSIVEINAYSFYYCSKLQNIKWSKSLQYIGSYAFSECDALTSVSLPEGLTKIGTGAFRFSDNLTEIIFPSTLTDIGKQTFEKCTSLKSVTIPGSVNYIEDRAFWYCSGLEEVIIEPGVKTIGIQSFDWCTNLKNVSISNTVKTINGASFQNCKSLTNINIPNSVTYIFGGTFVGCDDLRTLVIPKKATVQYDAFAKSTVLLVYENSPAHVYLSKNSYGYLYFVLRETENPEINYGAGITGTVKYTDGSVAVGATVEIIYNDGNVKEKVITDTNGAYAFTYAEVGQYTIRATDANSNTSTTTVSVNRMNVFDVYVAGDTDLTLKQGWTVSGTTSESSATVTITDELGNVIDTVETTDGTFTFSNIPNGTYVLIAATENGSISTEFTVFNDNVTGIVLVIPTSSEVVAIWGYVEVEDRDKNHHRRNWVEITVYNDDGFVIGQTRSDGDGAYRFENLPIGEYTIVAETSEMRPDKQHGFDRSHKLTGYAYVNAEEAIVYQADTIVLYEENDHNATISGKVTAHGEHQQCVVILSNIFRHEVARYNTAKNGKYNFTNVRDGMYFVTAITESDGMGYIVVVVREGKVYGDTDITVYKNPHIKDREDKFRSEVPEFESREDALAYKDRIADEKRFYDGLSEKEKKQLSKDYVERVNKYAEWIANVNYSTEEGVFVEQGGLVVSGDELKNEESITFALNVAKINTWEVSTDGVNTDLDYVHHAMEDTAGNSEIVVRYEITMTKSTADGSEKEITSVYNDTDAMGKFRITMVIPEEYRGYKNYTVIHEHHGEVVTLVDLDDNPDTVTFEVDKFSTFAIAVSNELTSTIYGDADADGNITVADTMIALKELVNNNNYNVILDVNEDGNVNLLDIIGIMKMLVA